MKNVLIYPLLILSIVLFHTCKEDSVPIVKTNDIVNIKGTTATSGGIITDKGSDVVISRGVCWSTNSLPNIGENNTNDSDSLGSFTSKMTGLEAATDYHVRAYATNSVGTGYGEEMSFRTVGQAPTATVAPATKINTTDATLHGVINANSLPTVVTFEYGLFPNYTGEITLSQSPLSGDTNTDVSTYVKDLVPGKMYVYRLKAINSLGIGYSHSITFQTKGVPPALALQPITNLTSSGVTLTAVLNQNYLSTTVTFEFGLTTNYGNTAPVGGLSIGGYLFVNVGLTGLSANTTYYFRYTAVNLLGTAYCSGYFTTALL